VIDQRNAGASVSFAANTSGYTLDRWSIDNSTDGSLTVQQSTVAPTGFANSILVTVTSADSSLASGQRSRVFQRIEGFNSAEFAWGTASASAITTSFWTRSSLTGTFGGALRNASSNRSYAFTYSISAANTWEYKTVNVAGDTTGTWATGNTSGIEVGFGLGAASDLSGTAGTWTATGNVSATGAVSVVGTSGATFYITGVQLEKGSTATAFDYRPYGTELALCQRYYEKIAIGLGGGYAAGGVNISNQARLMLPFSTPKRATPSYATSAASTFLVQINNGNTTPTSISFAGTTSTVSAYVFVAGTYTLNQPCILMDGQASTSFFEISSEL
jgi:hypothetical protein